MTKEFLLNTLEEDLEEDYYEDDFDKEYCMEELNGFIDRFEKRYHTTVNGFLLIAEREDRYGWSGRNGATGYRLIEDIEQLFDVRCDNMQVYIDDDKLIHVDYFDHDGANYSVVKLISETAWDAVYNDVGCYACELDYVEYLQKKNQLKPTRFWQAK